MISSYSAKSAFEGVAVRADTRFARALGQLAMEEDDVRTRAVERYVQAIAILTRR